MTELEITRGSDVRIQMNVSQNAAPVSLTGRTVSAFGADPQISGRISVSVIEEAAGEFEVRVDGTDPLPVGLYQFRIQIAGAGDSIGLPLFVLKVV